MAKVCYFTGLQDCIGKQPLSREWTKQDSAVKPNLQKVTVLIDGKPKSLGFPARALKSGRDRRVLIFI